MISTLILSLIHFLLELVIYLRSLATSVQNLWLCFRRKKTIANFNWQTLANRLLPKHIGISIAEEKLSYSDISNLIVWCMAVGITYISLYDHDGIIKKNKEILQKQVLATQSQLLGKDYTKYKLQINGMNRQNSSNGCSNLNRIVINIFSHEDGRPSITEVAKKICLSMADGKINASNIDVDLVNRHLQGHQPMPDPELLVCFGNTSSTLGFLPWHIRLTEIMCLPTHHRLPFENFLQILTVYSQCQQRFGK